MFVSMVVDNTVVAEAVRTGSYRLDPYYMPYEWAVDNAMNESTANMSCFSQGINSSWSATDIGDGRWLIEFGGPRYSLADWLPRAYRDEADRQWLLGELLEYRTLCPNESPTAVGLKPNIDMTKYVVLSTDHNYRYVNRIHKWTLEEFPYEKWEALDAIFYDGQTSGTFQACGGYTFSWWKVLETYIDEYEDAVPQKDKRYHPLRPGQRLVMGAFAREI